jgi:HprK-related kinase A
MRVGELGRDVLRERLESGVLAIRTGDFSFRVRSSIPSVAGGIALLYEDYPLIDAGEFVDFSLCMERSGGWRRWVRSQVRFRYEGFHPFEPLPLAHAFPLFEWSLNWCIGTQIQHRLLLHAGVIEKGGRAVIMPAPPGSGKSTLCAALIHRGWRLLSDELAVISLEDGSLWPLGRPVSLKNRSLDVIRAFEPGAVLSEATHDTAKGTVAHMKLPRSQVDALDVSAEAGWVVFPRYVAGAGPSLTPRSKADSLLELGRNSFNYSLLGLSGFDALADVVDRAQCFDFHYGDLDDAIAVFDRLERAG